MHSPLAGPTVGSSNAGSPQFVGFQLADQAYAFRIDRIREIVIPSSVTTLPDVPGFVAGVSNLRGTIIPIISLRALFGLPQPPLDAATRTVVVTVGPRLMGCLVDTVSRVMRISAAEIQPAPDTVAGAGRGYVEGFARVGDTIHILLDVDNLLDPAHLDAVHRHGASHVSPLPAPGAR